jgi:hypothetical protein
VTRVRTARTFSPHPACTAALKCAVVALLLGVVLMVPAAFPLLAVAGLVYLPAD